MTPAPVEAPASRPPAVDRAGLVVLAAGLAVQLAIAALGLPRAGRPLVGDEAMYVGVAEAWAAGRPAELDPLWPPGYPAAITAWITERGAPCSPTA